jgi:hypothetical protein
MRKTPRGNKNGVKDEDNEKTIDKRTTIKETNRRMKTS